MSCRKYHCVKCGRWIGQMHRHVAQFHKEYGNAHKVLHVYFPNLAEFKK